MEIVNLFQRFVMMVISAQQIPALMDNALFLQKIAMMGIPVLQTAVILHRVVLEPLLYA
jgi:hypothetical protein